jgi:hypothetical protein
MQWLLELKEPINIAALISTAAASRLAEMLLGHVTKWKPTGCIAHKHRNGVITELTRFRFSMNCDDEDVAKCFGLEIARLLLDTSFREFAMARYESEKRLIQQSRPPLLQR